MVRFPEAQIERNYKQTAAATGYPFLWRRMTSEWLRSDFPDRAWLLYSANYLLRTAGVRWALDPLTLHQRLPAASPVDLSPLKALEYIVLTHRHADHFDLQLLQQLKNFPARWIVPEFLLASLRTLNLPPDKLIIPRPLEPLSLGSLKLTPFEGLHWEAAPDFLNGQRGTESMGYLAEFNGKRWLFPGDTRTYEAERLPDFGAVDGLFAHLWLGRGCAKLGEPPLLNNFCCYCLALKPKRIVITHLNEWGRPDSELWTENHARITLERCKDFSPFTSISYALTGESVLL